MEKNYPPSLAKADLVMKITQMQSVAARRDTDILKLFEDATLAGYEGVESPGKKEWEEEPFRCGKPLG